MCELTSAVDAFLRAERRRHVADLLEFVRIPSVSTASEHAADVRHAAQWLTKTLRRAGAARANIHETNGHPAVIAHWPARERAAPTVLIYGHFDVQPPGPLDAWTSPPFAPVVRDERIYGRGASDDKGNLFVPIRAAETLAAVTGGPPVNVIFLCEGEEEIGSPNLRNLIERSADELRADVALSADGVMYAHDRPSVMRGFKGLLAFDLEVESATTELHSGLHGGLAPNAAAILSQIIASLYGADGTVVVEGFDVGAPAVTSGDRDAAEQANFDERAYCQAIGARACWGDSAYTPIERNWCRPTLDICGVTSGFQDEGMKTIIPAKASAKLACRLVAGQDPIEVANVLSTHVARHTPSSVSSTLVLRPGHCGGHRIEADDPVLHVVVDALRAAYGCEPLHARCGATLPACATLEETLGLNTMTLSWSMPDECIHAPDEFYRLENFYRGIQVYIDVFERIAAARSPARAAGRKPR